jgi:hypothetical protein
MRKQGIRPSLACLNIVIRDTPRIPASSSAVIALPKVAMRSRMLKGIAAASVGCVFNGDPLCPNYWRCCFLAAP